MSDNMKLSKDKRHRSSSSITGAGIDVTRSERKLDARGLIPEVGDYFALAESRCDDLQEKIDLLKVLKRKKKMSKRSMTRVDGTIPESPVPLISVRTQPKKKVSGQTARPRRVEGPVAGAAVAVRGYVDPAYVEQHRMLGQVWAADRKTPQNEYQAGPRQYQSPRATRRNRADGDGMCGQKIKAEAACGLDDASAYRDHHALTDIFHQDGRKLKKNEASGSTLDRVKLGTAGNQSGMDIPTAGRRRPMQQAPPQQQFQRQQQMYQHPYQQQLSLPKINERPVVELFNKNRTGASPPPLSSPRSRPDSRDKPNNTHEEAARSDLVVGQSAASAEPYKKVRRKPWSRNYELPTVASQLKQVEARQSRSGAVTNSSYIPFVVSKNTGPSYNIGINVQQVLNGMKIQQPLKDIPLTIAHHMGLGHIPTYKTKRVNKLEKPSLSRSAINAITMGARTLTLPSRRSISYNRLLSMYSSGDGMVSRFLRANARVSEYLYTSLYDLRRTREAAESSEQSVPSEQAERAEQDERAVQDEQDEQRDEREGRASASKNARARRRRRYQQLAQLYREYKRLERVHEDGAGTEETARRYNEIIRILRANKDYMAQQGEVEMKSSMPRKTSTNTTLVSSGTDRLERESSPVGQVGEWARVGGRPPSGGGGSKASVQDVRLSHSHYPPGESRLGDPRKTPTQSFH